MADSYLVDASYLRYEPKNELQEKKLALIKVHYAEHELAMEKKRVEEQERNKRLSKRFDAYNDEYRKEEESIKENIADCEANGGFYRLAEPKILLVVRIKGVNKLCPRVRKVFQLFRLMQIHNAVFIKVNKATLNMLKYIEPFVAYGYPSLETIRKLVYKRGYLRIGSKLPFQRIRISDNALISNIKIPNIEGIEDIVHEIYTCGPNFKEVNRALWTFKLRSPTKGFICKRHGFAEFRGGDWGNREEYINDLVQRML